ncbi:MAG: hypothetical protein MUC50_15385, partial [Myxococcota bacterium]|nr:hypothetical protein [Myxococcota bacterium]
MHDRIRTLVALLEKNPLDEEAMTGLMDLVTGDESKFHEQEIRDALVDCRRDLIRRGRAHIAVRLVELEAALVQGPDDEAELVLEEARILDEEVFDQEQALVAYRKAASLRPDDLEIQSKISAIEEERANYREIVDKFVEQAEEAEDSALRAHMLMCAAERLYKNGQRDERLTALLGRALDADPTHIRAARLLEKIYINLEQWNELSELYLRLVEQRQPRDERFVLLLSAARVKANKLMDYDGAAILFAEVLDLEPGNSTALRHLAQYYESKEDWGRLVVLYDDALALNPKREDETALLTQLGMTHWRMLGDLDKAEGYFKRLRKLEPAHPAMVNFYRSYSAQVEDKSRLMQVLTDAQRATSNKDQKDQLTKDIAQLAAADGGNVERAIEAWKSVLRKEPGNQEARRELRRLYWESQKWNGLLELLRSEAESLPPEDTAGKVGLYEEIVRIYRDHLELPTMVINTYRTIIELDPSNIGAQAELSKSYEREGRWNDLINLLIARAARTTDQAQRVEILSHVATLWIERFNNFNRALGPLEEIRALDPTNLKANETLRSVFVKRRSWKQLLELMEDEAKGLEGEALVSHLKEMALLAADRLSDAERAVAVWKWVLQESPGDEAALSTLEKLYERTKDWAGLADVLDRRIGLCDSLNDKVNLLIKLGAVAKERLRDPVLTASAWHRVLELQPGHVKAMRSLKEAYLQAEDWGSLEKLYAQAGDYEGLVEVLGVSADRVENVGVKKALSFRCAELYENEIAQAERATRHYERVLAVEADNERAALALAPIYRKAEKWNRLVGALEVVLRHTAEPVERVVLMDELREIGATRMNNRNMAFVWAARAFDELPEDEGVRQCLESTAEAAGKLEELVQIYRKRLGALEPAGQLEMHRRIAGLCLNRIGDTEGGIQAWRAVLTSSPTDVEATEALDTVLRSSAAWGDLIELYEHRLKLADNDTERCRLLSELGGMLEDGMDRIDDAAVRYREVLVLSPDDSHALLALERIAKTKEDWMGLAEILEKRRSVAGDDPSWRALTFQLAEVTDKQLGAKEASIALYQELLEQYPADLEVISNMEHFLRDEGTQVEVARILEPHLYASDSHRLLAWALSIELEATTKLKKRLALHNKLANLYREKLGDLRLTFDTLAAALSEHPGNTDLWDDLAGLAVQLGAQEDLAVHLITAYDSGKVKEKGLEELASRLAQLLEVELGRASEAAPYHEFVFSADPTASTPFNALESYYTTHERWTELLHLYRRALESGSSVYPALDLRLRICFILEEVQQDSPAAIAEYRLVVDADPANVQANRALTILYEQCERWTDSEALLETQLSRASDMEAVALRYRLGEICEQKLDKPLAAFECYELVLTQDPDHLRAQEAMERLLERPDLRQKAARVLEKTYEHQGADEPLARVLGVQLEDEGLEAEERIDILMRVASLRERRLGDVDGAFGALSQAFALKPSNTFARNELARVAAEANMAADYAEVIDRVIPSVMDDHAVASNLMSEVARLYDEQLADLRKAEAAYRRLIDLDPTNRVTALPAAEALERLLAGNESFEPLLYVLRLKVSLLESPEDQIRVLHRMAEIEESVLERVDRAVELYREILDEDPSDMAALYGLERLFERLGQWRDLIDTLRRRVDVETDSETKRELLLRVARLFEERLSSLDEAISAYIAVGQEVGPDLEAIDALVRLYESTGRWKDLLSTLEAKDQLVEDPALRTRLLFSMGELLRLRLDEPSQAVERLGEALEIDPNHAGARAALTELLTSPVRMEAIRILRPLFEAAGDYSQLLRCSLIQAEETDDPLARSAVLQKAAEIAETGLSDPAQAFALLGRALRDGATAPEVPRVIYDLERLAQATDNAEQLLVLYREVAPDILDAEIQIQCALRVAELSEAKGDVSMAREHYVRILDIDSANDRALNALTAIYESTSQWVELLDIYRRKFHMAKDEATRHEILFKQASLCEDRLGDISQAMTTYETILADSPGHTRAMEALERLYEREGRYADLASLLEQRAEIDVTDRPDLLHRLGLLASDKLGDDERALDYFRRVLEIDHVHAATIESLEAAMSVESRRGRVAEILEPVYKGSCDWVKLVGALEAKLELTDDVSDRKDLLHQIGMLYEEQLGDLDKAFETFARMFSEDIEDRSSWDILERLASVLEKWGRLSEVYADALDSVVSDTSASAELTFALGEVYETRLSEPLKAIAAYRRALSFSPDNDQAYAAVERMLILTSNWKDLLDLYREAADTALDMVRRREIIYKMADIYEHALGDLDAAIDAFRSTLDLDARDMHSIEALDRLYAASKRYEDLTLHLRAQIDEADSPIERNELRCRLAHVYEENLEEPNMAVDIYEEALHEDGGGISEPLAALERLILNEDLRQRIAEILEPCYRETDEWKKLVVILRTQIEYLEDPLERARRYREIADLHSKRGQNFLLAFDSLSEAFKAQPQDRDTLEELVRLSGSIENWDVLAGVLAASVDEIYDLDFKSEVFHLLGAIYDRNLDQPRKAIDAFLKVLEINEADAEVITALEGLYNLIGDWDGLVAVLARKAEHASDPAARAGILRTKAAIHEDLMSSVDDAILAYRAALEEEPTSVVTIAALERLYETTSAWPDVIDMLRHRLELTEDTVERGAILRSIARLHEERIADRFEAISSWRAVLEEDGKDRAAVTALAKLYTVEGMFPDLLEILELDRSIAPDQQAWVESSLRIASLQEKELSDPGAAIESYRDVLSQHPTNAVAIEALERIAQEETYRG